MSGWTTQYRKVIIKGLVVVALLVVGCGLFIYPLYLDALRLEKEIADTELDIARQIVFAPEYALLETMSAEGAEAHFPVPKPEPVAVRDFVDIPKRVAGIATGVGFTVLDVIINPSSLEKNQNRLMIQIIASGSVQEFREFYRELCGLGLVSYVSRVEMQAVPEALEFFVEFWVHIGEKA